MRMRWAVGSAWLAAFACLCAASPASVGIRFTEVSGALGLHFTQQNSATSNKYLIETMGGGVALLDYDNDGRLDIFFTNGARLLDPMPDGAIPDKSDTKYWNRLFHQQQNGTFVDVTERAGLTGVPQNGYGMMNAFERRGAVVGMSAVSDLVNGWPGGIIQASRHGLFVTPIYLVNKLYATHLGAERLATRVDGPTFASSHEGDSVPTVDVAASRSADGRSIFVKAVNADLERSVALRITMRGVRVNSRGTVDQVTADSLEGTSSFQAPDAVRTTQTSVSTGDSFSVELPRHSVSVVTLTVVR